MLDTLETNSKSIGLHGLGLGDGLGVVASHALQSSWKESGTFEFTEPGAS